MSKREHHRRKNFKVGDPCDGFHPATGNVYILSKSYEGYRNQTDHVFVEQYFREDNNSLMLKQKVYGSKLVDALCVN